MATINQDNVSEYIKQGLIDPSKIRIDLNVNKTTSDPNHKWITLDSAIRLGLEFNFNYDVKELDIPKTKTLPELEINYTKPKLEPKMDSGISPETDKENLLNNKPWWRIGEENFRRTFGVDPKEIAYYLPGIGDALSLKDIYDDVLKGSYGSAALGASMFFVPNIIDSPLKSLVRAFKNRKVGNVMELVLRMPTNKEYVNSKGFLTNLDTELNKIHFKDKVDLSGNNWYHWTSNNSVKTNQNRYGNSEVFVSYGTPWKELVGRDLHVFPEGTFADRYSTNYMGVPTNTSIKELGTAKVNDTEKYNRMLGDIELNFSFLREDDVKRNLLSDFFFGNLTTIPLREFTDAFVNTPHEVWRTSPEGKVYKSYHTKSIEYPSDEHINFGEFKLYDN